MLSQLFNIPITSYNMNNNEWTVICDYGYENHLFVK